MEAGRLTDFTDGSVFEDGFDRMDIEDGAVGKGVLLDDAVISSAKGGIGTLKEGCNGVGDCVYVYGSPGSARSFWQGLVVTKSGRVGDVDVFESFLILDVDGLDVPFSVAECHLEVICRQAGFAGHVSFPDEERGFARVLAWSSFICLWYVQPAD